MATSTMVLLGMLVVIVFTIIGIFNKLVMLKNRYQNAFAQIEVQLKRRYDLIPNLVDIAKGYLEHERGTLEAIVTARNQAITGLQAASADPGNPLAMMDLAKAEDMLSSAMGKLSIVVEAYPDLKANENMMQLSEELTSTENKVAFSRQAFNDAVTEYNTYKQTFPSVLLAAKFGHSENASLLEFEDTVAIQDAPQVTF